MFFQSFNSLYAKSYCFSEPVMQCLFYTRFPLTWNVRELILSGKVGEFCLWPGKIVCIIRVV